MKLHALRPIRKKKNCKTTEGEWVVKETYFKTFQLPVFQSKENSFNLQFNMNIQLRNMEINEMVFSREINCFYLFARSCGVSWANFAMTSSMLLKSPKEKEKI